MILPVLKICGNIPASVQLLYNLAGNGEISLADFLIRIVGISLAFPFSKSYIMSTISKSYVSYR